MVSNPALFCLARHGLMQCALVRAAQGFMCFCCAAVLSACVRCQSAGWCLSVQQVRQAGVELPCTLVLGSPAFCLCPELSFAAGAPAVCLSQARVQKVPQCAAVWRTVSLCHASVGAAWLEGRAVPVLVALGLSELGFIEECWVTEYRAVRACGTR